jgi:hypothetical protein
LGTPEGKKKAQIRPDERRGVLYRIFADLSIASKASGASESLITHSLPRRLVQVLPDSISAADCCDTPNDPVVLCKVPLLAGAFGLASVGVQFRGEVVESRSRF